MKQEMKSEKLKTTKDETKIPKGGYCYNVIKFEKGKIKIKLCPYWRKIENKPEQADGYCIFLEKGDFQENGTSLLWDQCKECGKNL
jgi:hypothetical protein